MTDEDFDLAKQIRIAERNKRIAERMALERTRSYRVAAFWGVVAAISTIALGLYVAMQVAVGRL